MTDFIYFMLQSSLLIILVLIIRRAGRRYISARAVYGLWLIPMARLLFPFALVSVMLPPALCGLHPYAVVQEAAKGAAAAAARMDGREEGAADDFQTGQLLDGAVNGESAGKENGAAGRRKLCRMQPGGWGRDFGPLSSGRQAAWLQQLFFCTKTSVF